MQMKLFNKNDINNNNKKNNVNNNNNNNNKNIIIIFIISSITKYHSLLLKLWDQSNFMYM